MFSHSVQFSLVRMVFLCFVWTQTQHLTAGTTNTTHTATLLNLRPKNWFAHNYINRKTTLNDKLKRCGEMMRMAVDLPTFYADFGAGGRGAKQQWSATELQRSLRASGPARLRPLSLSWGSSTWHNPACVNNI